MWISNWDTTRERQNLLRASVSAILRCCVLRWPDAPSGPWSGRHVWQPPPDLPNSPEDRNRALEFERNRIAVVMIRLARFGARKQPYYRVVVIEKDRARNGRSIEVVGTYNPRTNPTSVDLKYERISYWQGVGAQLSPIVAKLVKKFPAAAPVAETTAA
jgi:small subunit ribosomal protein S16